MSNYQRINANSVALGENEGQATLKSANDNKLKVNGDIVANDNTPVITYTDSSNTINFHNKPVVNFSGGGGGGGGDAFLNGGTALVTPQEFTGFNRFDNDVQLKDHLLFSDDGVVEKAKISATGNEMKIQTDTATDIISLKLGNAGSTNTLELKQDPDATSQNGLFLRQNGSGGTLDKVLTDSSQDLGVIVDAVEISPNTFTAANTFSTQTTLNGINNSGGLTNSNGMVNTGGMTSDVLTCQGLLNTQSLTATQTITGNELLSNGNITCGVGSNFIVGGTQISSSDLFDSSSIVKNTDSSLTIAGQIQGDTLISTNNITSLNGGIILNQGVTAAGNIISTAANMEARGGEISFRSADCKITDDSNRNLTIRAASELNKIYLTFDGTDPYQTMKVDILSNKGRIQLWDYGRASYYDVGQNPDDITQLIALLNNTSLTFNPTTTLISQGIFSHSGNTCNLINGTGNGTLNIGNAASTDGVFIDADTTFRQDIAVASTMDIFSPDLDGGTKGVIEVCDGCVDRTLTSWEPTVTTITPVSGYINNITNLFVASFVRVRFGTNHFITMRGGFAPSSGTFPSGNFTVANMGSTYAPFKNMYFSYQLQPGVPGGMVNLTPTGDFILIGLTGNETEVYLGGIQYFVN